MMTQYPIDKKGRISSDGDYAGWNIEIKKAGPNDDGYLILIWSDKTNQGYDGWVGSEEDLDGYFTEQGWIVEWD